MLQIKTKLKQVTSIACAFVLAFMGMLAVLPQEASAAQITGRSLEISDSAGGATGVTYTFTFTLPSATVLESFEVDICEEASGGCTTPTGFVNSSSTLASQPTNLGDGTGWTVSTATAGSLRISKTGNSAAPSGEVTVVFGNVTNPTADNEVFFGQMTTYSNDDWTGAVDTGTVASGTAAEINITATVAETLSFCTGTSGVSTSSCSGATGSTVALGTLNSSTTASGTSQIGVGTNANSGYAVTVNGATLTSGSNTITAIGSATTSSTGSEQFGLNLKDNATPNVGSEVDGSGSGTAESGYDTADNYQFNDGDSVASNSGSDDFNRFTVSYIANIATATEAGDYSATLTYICTPQY